MILTLICYSVGRVRIACGKQDIDGSASIIKFYREDELEAFYTERATIEAENQFDFVTVLVNGIPDHHLTPEEYAVYVPIEQEMWDRNNAAIHARRKKAHELRKLEREKRLTDERLGK